KHGKRPVPFSAWQLPFHAIDYCLGQAGIALRDVDHIGYSFDPRLLPGSDEGQWMRLPLRPSDEAQAEDGGNPWDPLFLSYVINAPRQLLDGVPHHLQDRFRDLSLADLRARWSSVEHHLSHEASAFLAAPCDSCAVLTLDGRGERATTSFGHFADGRYTRIKQINLP